MDESDAAFRALLDRTLRTPLEKTRAVALRAMVLEDLDRVKYQELIAQCAQVLVDTQDAGGRWGDGGAPVEPLAAPPTAVKPARTPKLCIFERREKPRVQKRIRIEAKAQGAAAGDDVDSFFAALGLCACAEAGVRAPDATLRKAASAWRDVQAADGGWATLPRSAAGTASVTIYAYLDRRDFKKDKGALAGLEWLGKNFSAGVVPTPGSSDPAFTLFAIEKAGMLYGTEKFSAREWYPAIARALLDAQRKDGSWSLRPGGSVIEDTCYSLLVLKKTMLGRE